MLIENVSIHENVKACIYVISVGRVLKTWDKGPNNTVELSDTTIFGIAAPAFTHADSQFRIDMVFWLFDSIYTTGTWLDLPAIVMTS